MEAKNDPGDAALLQELGTSAGFIREMIPADRSTEPDIKQYAQFDRFRIADLPKTNFIYYASLNSKGFTISELTPIGIQPDEGEIKYYIPKVIEGRNITYMSVCSKEEFDAQLTRYQEKAESLRDDS